MIKIALSDTVVWYLDAYYDTIPLIIRPLANLKPYWALYQTTKPQSRRLVAKKEKREHTEMEERSRIDGRLELLKISGTTLLIL